MSKTKKTTLIKKAHLSKVITSYAIYVLIVIFGCLYAFIGITKYIHYQTGLDLAIYVQSFWFYTHFSLPYVTLSPTYGDLVWADHFSPSLMLLTPFYFLWPDPKTLIVLQSFIYTAGAYPVYRFAKEKLQSQMLALALAFSFLTFFGTQNPLTFDFHLGTIAASFLPWILWAMFKKKWKIFVVLCVVASGFKEDMPLYVATLSLYLILSRKNWKLGGILLVVSIAYEVLITKYIMPSLVHYAQKTFSVAYFKLDPAYLWALFFDNPAKMHTVFLSFANYLFIPLFSGPFLLLPFAHFFINFSNPEYPGRWDIYLHYRAYLTSIMAFGTILGLVGLAKRWPKVFARSTFKNIIASLLVVTALLFDFFLHLPLNSLAKKQFYYKENWIADNDKIARKIPEDAYLLTTNHLAPQVSYRKHVYYFPQHIDEADYIFVDLHPNQPIINFWYSAHIQEDLDNHIKSIIRSKKYVIVEKSGDAYLLKRNN